MPRPTSRRVLARAGVALLGIAVAVACAELAVLALDPFGVSDARNGERYREELVVVDVSSPRLFRHRPNARVRMRGFEVRTDSRGLRGPERATPKPAGVRRVLFLGDSVVFGWGVDEEDTFVALVERELRARTAERWEAVNAGHLLHDTTQELGVLEEVGLSYEPDLVLLVFVENDVVPTRAVFEMQAGDPLEDPATSAEARAFLRNTRRLARLKPVLPSIHALLQHLYVRSHPAGATGSAEHAVELGIDLEAGMDAVRSAILVMRDRLAERGILFAVLDYRRTEALAAFCGVSGIPYASIAFTEEEAAQDLRNSSADAHANPLGHRYLARHVLDALERLELVDP